MGELALEIHGEMDEELDESLEVVKNYIDVGGFEWVRPQLESLEDFTYIKDLAEEIIKEISEQDEIDKPFTEDDEKNYRFAYIIEIDMAKEKGEDVSKVKREFLSLDDDEEGYDESNDEEDYE